MGKRVYNQEKYKWVVDNFGNYDNSKKLAEAFSLKFNIEMTDTKIRSLCKTLNLSRGRQDGYTNEQDIWLKNIHEKKSFREVTELFNEKFGCNRSRDSIMKHCINTLNLRYENQYRYGSKIPGNTKKLLSEYVNSQGVTLIKTERGKWQSKTRYVYEKYKGKVGKGFQVIQLDRDKNNFSLDNLEKVPLQYMLMLNRNRWITENAEITKTAIKLCELRYTALNQ